MRIRILCVGKLKERFYKEACQEFCKRLSRYAQVEILEVADEKAPEQLSPAQRRQVKEAEGARLLQKVAEGDYVVALDIAGWPRTISTDLLWNKKAPPGEAGSWLRQHLQGHGRK